MRLLDAGRPHLERVWYVAPDSPLPPCVAPLLSPRAFAYRLSCTVCRGLLASRWAGVEFGHANVLASEELRQGIKEYRCAAR